MRWLNTARSVVSGKSAAIWQGVRRRILVVVAPPANDDVTPIGLLATADEIKRRKLIRAALAHHAKVIALARRC